MEIYAIATGIRCEVIVQGSSNKAAIFTVSFWYRYVILRSLTLTVGMGSREKNLIVM